MKLTKIGDKFASVDGKLLKTYQFPTAKLLADFCVLNDTVYNLATGKQFTKFTAEEGYFKGNGTSNIISGNSLSSFTIVMIADRPLYHDYQNYFAVNGSTIYPIRIRMVNGGGSWNDFEKDLTPKGSFGQTEYAYAKFAPRLLTVGTDEFLSISRNAGTKEILIQQNEVQSIETYTDEVPDLTSVKLLTGRKYKRFMVYDGALSAEEIQQICEIRYGKNTTKYYPSEFAQGITGLGCPNGYYALSSQLPEWDDSVEFAAIEQENPVVEEDMSGFTALYFINPISELEVGKKYNLEAHPYPYDVTATPFNIEYETNNAEVLECYKGFLIAKAVGTAKITARISNTDITASLEIAVREVQEIEKNYRCLGKSYSDGTNALISEDSEEVLKAMISAIYETAERGFNGIVFPKRTYHIKPFQKEPHCNVPTNFTIDFNGSTIYIDDNKYCHCEAGVANQSDGYTLFKFGEGNYSDYYGNACEYSVIRNATVYGERYGNTIYAENEYTEFTRFVTFGCRSVGCKVTDMYFEATCGFHIDTATNGYEYWSGTGVDGARRGCTLAEDYAQGRIAVDGETITDESGWYYTTDFIKIGYYYGTGSYTSILQYKVGLMGYMTYGTTGRWYDIFLYDENYNLVEKGIHQFGLEPYGFPEKAVYMKMNIMTNSTPSTNNTTDVPAVVRLYPAVEPDLFEISNCKFINPHASAISITGGVRGIIENCYAQQGARYGWSIDFEDGWLAMRHNILYRVMCNGMIVFPSGHNTAVVSSAVDVMQCLGDTEGLRHINCHYGVLRLKTKTNDVVECVTQNATYPYQYQYSGVSTIREINNTVK